MCAFSSAPNLCKKSKSFYNMPNKSFQLNIIAGNKRFFFLIFVTIHYSYTHSTLSANWNAINEFPHVANTFVPNKENKIDISFTKTHTLVDF